MGDGGSNQRSIAASSTGANTRIATAAASATGTSNQANGTGRNLRPASSSLCRIAIAAAGPRKVNTTRPNAMPTATMSSAIRR